MRRRLLLRCRRGALQSPIGSPPVGTVARPGSRDDPRDPSVPAEEQAARPPVGHRAAQFGASGPPDCPRHPLVRRHLLVGLRDGAGADPMIKVIGVAASRLLMPVSVAVIVRARLRHPVLPRGGEGLHEGRRRLRGGEGEFQANVAQVRCGLPADRLFPHRRGVRGRRCGRAHRRCSRARPRDDGDRHRVVVSSAYANLRGVREAGRVFALPTYFFIVNMALLWWWAPPSAVLGQLHAHSIHQSGAVTIGHPGQGSSLAPAPSC